MMGPWKGWYTVAIAIAWVLSLSVVHFASKKDGETIQKLLDNKTQIHASDSSTKSVQIRAEHQKAVTAALDSTHDVIRTKVRVQHDSVFVRDTVYVDADIAQLIQADDSLIAAQKRTIALQDTLISSLRVGLNLRDTRIKLLEREVTPGKLKRIITATKWVAVGAIIGVAYQRR